MNQSMPEADTMVSDRWLEITNKEGDSMVINEYGDKNRPLVLLLAPELELLLALLVPDHPAT